MGSLYEFPRMHPTTLSNIGGVPIFLSLSPSESVEEWTSLTVGPASTSRERDATEASSDPVCPCAFMFVLSIILVKLLVLILLAVVVLVVCLRLYLLWFVVTPGEALQRRRLLGSTTTTSNTIVWPIVVHILYLNFNNSNGMYRNTSKKATLGQLRP